jgi:S1-C subfamily serine protease
MTLPPVSAATALCGAITLELTTEREISLTKVLGRHQCTGGFSSSNSAGMVVGFKRSISRPTLLRQNGRQKWLSWLKALHLLKRNDLLIQSFGSMTRAVLILAAASFLGLLTADCGRGENYNYGTCFFVHPDGFLLTNQHVIADAKEVRVVTSDARILPARVIRDDAYKDLALLKVDVTKAPYLPLGRSADVKVLDSIIAVGFPYPDKIGAELSAYDGKVNAIRESGHIPMLQMDANVNPGISGGPVLNDRGEVVGIVVGKVNAVAALLKEGDLPERINFAIPIDECKGVISAAYPFGYPPQTGSEKLEPGAIFRLAKPAIAFVAAEVASQASDSTRQSLGKEEVLLAASTWPDGRRLRSPEKHVYCRVRNVPANDVLYMRQGPGASYQKVMASATIAVALPPNATNVIVFVEDWEKNENDVWYRVSWRGYKGYLRDKFLTPQN